MKKKEKTGKETAEKWKAGGVIAALAAAAAVFIVMLQLEKNMLTQYEKGTVYVAAAEIPRGQMVTQENLSLYLQEKALDSSCIPAGALRSPEQVAGLAARFDIEPGVLLAEGMFEGLNDILLGMQEPVVAGFKAEDLYQVAGGVLRAGDRIHIYRVSEEGQAALVWDNVYVQEVFDQAGSRIASGDPVTAAQRINIYLDKKDVETFYSELAGGALRVVQAVGPESAGTGQRAPEPGGMPSGWQDPDTEGAAAELESEPEGATAGQESEPGGMPSGWQDPGTEGAAAGQESEPGGVLSGQGES